MAATAARSWGMSEGGGEAGGRGGETGDMPDDGGLAGEARWSSSAGELFSFERVGDIGLYPRPGAHGGLGRWSMSSKRTVDVGLYHPVCESGEAGGRAGQNSSAGWLLRREQSLGS